MNRAELSDREWAILLATLKGVPEIHVHFLDICQQFIADLLWFLRLDAQYPLPMTIGAGCSSIFRVGVPLEYEKKAIKT